MTKKTVLEELDKPDLLHTLFNRVVEFYTSNKKKVLSIAGAVLLVLLIIIGWFSYRYYREKEAWSQYAKIEESEFTQNSSANTDTLIKKYLALSSKYSGSQASQLSDYRLGNLYFNKNEIEPAIKSYEKFISHASDKNEFKALSYISLAYCYEKKKDYQKALNVLQQAENIEAGKNFGTFIYRDMGRIYEEMQNYKEALKYYNKALEQSLEPTITLFIKRKIANLS